MIVDVSQFDVSVDLYAPTVSNSSTSGESVTTYALSKSVWANVDTRAMNESFIQNKRSSNTSVVLNIRSDSSITITAKWRFIMEGTTYQISGVVPNTNFPRGEILRVTGEVIS